MHIRVVTSDINDFFDSPENEHTWNLLWQNSPWVTPFQTFSYARLWYKHYAGSHTPVIVCGEKDGRITGILALAMQNRSGLLSFAGWLSAEYHAAIAEPEHAEAFLLSAFSALKDTYPDSRIIMRYIPHGHPTDWMEHIPYHTDIKQVDAPTVDMDEALVTKLFKKKHTRSRINTFKRSGNLEYRRITTEAAFKSFFYTCNLFWDMRHAAIHHVPVTYPDHKRYAYFIDMLHTGLMHVSGLYLDEELLSGHIGMAGRGMLHLGDMGYAPKHGKLSPGNIHRIFLMEELLQQGIPMLDLTPGGDAYKIRFANNTRQVTALTCYPAQSGLRKAKAIDSIERMGAKILRAVNIQPPLVRQFLAARHHIVPKHWPALWRHINDRLEPEAIPLPGKDNTATGPSTHPSTHPSTRPASISDATHLLAPPQYDIQKDSIAHMLRHPDGVRGITSYLFLKQCLITLERGGHVLSVCFSSNEAPHDMPQAIAGYVLVDKLAPGKPDTTQQKKTKDQPTPEQYSVTVHAMADAKASSTQTEGAQTGKVQQENFDARQAEHDMIACILDYLSSQLQIQPEQVQLHRMP